MSASATDPKESHPKQSHLDNELLMVKKNVLEMWDSVIHQMLKAREVLVSSNRDLISEMAAGEKFIDAFELKLDMDCENLLALYNPVANDLRYVLAVLKINYNLERIGDFAWSTAKAIRDLETPLGNESLEKTGILLMFDTAILMLKDAQEAFENSNNQLASSIFEKDRILDENNKASIGRITELIKADPQRIGNYLSLLTIIKKAERIGDHTKNIAEEIIFYIEAKVLRHSRKKNK